MVIVLVGAGLAAGLAYVDALSAEVATILGMVIGIGGSAVGATNGKVEK
jgi:hypothetical protein